MIFQIQKGSERYEVEVNCQKYAVHVVGNGADGKSSAHFRFGG